MPGESRAARDRDAGSRNALADLAPRLVEFAVLAHEQHVTRAAEVLGIPQPTLTRRLARLQQDLGVALVVRAGRGVRLTAAGEELRRAVERALDALEHGLQQILRDADPAHGKVAVGFMHTLGPVVIPRVLQEFRREHPGVRFELHQEGHQAMLAELRGGSIDLCLTSPLPEDPDLASHPLTRQDLACLMPTGHPLATRRPLPLAELAGEVFVGLKPGYGIRAITDGWCRRAGFTPRLAFQGDDIDTVRGLVAAGLGVALLPTDPAHAPAGTVEVRIAPEATRTIGLVWPRERPEPVPVALFRQFLLARGSELLGG